MLESNHFQDCDQMSPTQCDLLELTQKTSLVKMCSWDVFTLVVFLSRVD